MDRTARRLRLLVGLGALALVATAALASTGPSASLAGSATYPGPRCSGRPRVGPEVPRTRRTTALRRAHVEERLVLAERTVAFLGELFEARRNRPGVHP